MNKLKEKLILNEDDTFETEEEKEVIPAAELEQEPLLPPLDLDMPDEKDIEEVENNNEFIPFVSMINNAIGGEWTSIDILNNVISTFAMEKPDEIGVIDILKQIVEEKTAHVGMLQRALELVDEGNTELLQKGKEKAEEIIDDSPIEEEPVEEDNEENKLEDEEIEEGEK
jgi:hypothetical protein